MIVSIVTCGALRLALLILIPALPAAGQDVSYQLRLVGHTQVVRAGDRFGVAAWGVLPDVMNQTSLRALLFGGGVYKRETGWIEFMGGALLSRTEKTTYEIDVRYSGRLSRISVFAESEYNGGTRKWFILPSATVPARIARLRFGVGAESDFVFSPGGKLIVAGPRVAVPLPLCRHVCRGASVITALRLQSDGRRVVRNYVAFAF